MLENKMLLDEYFETEKTDWDKYYEAMAEKEDEKWDDIDLGGIEIWH